MKRIISPLLALTCVALLSGPVRAEGGKKDPTISGCLSFFVGLGSGHYYAQDGKAPIFTAVELGLLGGTVATASDSPGLAVGLWTGLFAFRIYEVVDGIGAAKRYNARHGLAFDSPFRAPKVGVTFGEAFGGVNSARYSALYATGGANRDLALSMGQSRSYLPTWQFTIPTDAPGVGLSFNGSF
ncbi:MAG: hypothetical protein IT204_10385 [Fimbriimonadaceae bacterium]|nr:hypothetical protein [Fimbriimonadaceae bacterium]